MNQKYTSADTSINTINAVYTNMPFMKNSVVLDYGGGKFDTNKEYMANRGVFVHIYDPFNRTPSHNSKVMSIFKNKKPDYIVNSNVLNVIKEDEIVMDVIKKIHNIAGKKTICYFAIYEGNRTGKGNPTVKGYQRNEKAIAYIPLIASVFPNVTRKGAIIIATK